MQYTISPALLIVLLKLYTTFFDCDFIQILKFLTVQTSMAGLYFANISNDRGQQNYSYTQFDVVCEFYHYYHAQICFSYQLNKIPV